MLLVVGLLFVLLPVVLLFVCYESEWSSWSTMFKRWQLLVDNNDNDNNNNKDNNNNDKQWQPRDANMTRSNNNNNEQQ